MGAKKTTKSSKAAKAAKRMSKSDMRRSKGGILIGMSVLPTQVKIN